MPKQGASLREAAELIGIEMIELATTVLEYGSCMIGEFRAVPSGEMTEGSSRTR
jgi:hypothetical protein